MTILNQYVNTGIKAGQATFVDTIASAPEVNTLTQSTKVTEVKTASGPIRMCSVTQTLTVPFLVESCEANGGRGSWVNTSLSIKVNVPYADETTAVALLTENKRVLDIALPLLLRGLVSAPTSQFTNDA